MKEILYYVLFTDEETKTLNRCKEIASEKTAKEVFEKLNERLSKI